MSTPNVQNIDQLLEMALDQDAQKRNAGMQSLNELADKRNQTAFSHSHKELLSSCRNLPKDLEYRIIT